MGTWSEQSDRTKRVFFEPRVVRAFWSKERAWQGDEVLLHVETEHVRDGSKLTIEIRQVGTDLPITEVAGPHEVKRNRVIAKHALKWDADSLGKEVDPKEPFDFYFAVTCESPPLEGRSASMYVDLHALEISV